MVIVEFDRNYFPCPPGCEFVTDTSRSCKKIQYGGILNIYIIGTLNKFSLAKSVVGRALKFLSGVMILPLCVPLIIRIDEDLTSE